MVAGPRAAPVADPAVLMVAFDEELQVTRVVRSWVVPSAYVPVAVNC